MHKQWEDLIPFYIAQTLSNHEAAALEQHLAGCDVCRRSMDEWRAIATAVRTQAASQLRDLPPLVLPSSRSGAARQAIYGQARRDPWRWMTPVALVAAMVAVVVGMGLIALIVSRSLRPIEEASQTSVAALVTNTPSSEGAAGNPTAMIFSTLPITPTASATPIPPTFTLTQRPPVQPPNPTRIPFTPQSSIIEGVGEVQIPYGTTPAPEIWTVPVTETPPLFSTLTPEGGGETLLMPELPGDDFCRLFPATSPYSLYTGPGFGYAPMADLTFDDVLTPLAVGDNGWYRVEANIRGGSWVGWVRPDTVAPSGNCAALPVIGTQNYPPESGVPTSNAPFGIVETPTEIAPTWTSEPPTLEPTIEIIVTFEAQPQP
jgi:hypothetical protein